MAKADPATTVAGAAVSAVALDTPQLGAKFGEGAPTGTEGKYCVKVTKA